MIENEHFEGVKAKIVINDIAPSLLNGLRRTLLIDLPKLAIDEVVFYENSSPLTNEILAHRLAMLPIPTDPDIFVRREECSCDGKGCSNCTLIYTLSKDGPCMVYSRDLEAQKGGYDIPDPDIPLVKLEKNQKLIFEAMAILGTAKEHAKFQAAFAIGYKNYPVITIDNKKCDLGRTCIEVCPPEIIKKEGNRIKITDIEKCILCRECENKCEFGAIKVDYDKDRFILRFETDGAMDPKNVFIRGLNILDEKLENLKKEMLTELD